MPRFHNNTLSLNLVESHLCYRTKPDHSISRRFDWLVWKKYSSIVYSPDPVLAPHYTMFPGQTNNDCRDHLPPVKVPLNARTCQRGWGWPSLSLLEAVLLSFVEKICLGSTKIDNFWTSVSILLQLDTFAAVVGIRYAWISTNNTTPFIAAIIAFVAYMDQSVGIDKGITDDAFAITCE